MHCSRIDADNEMSHCNSSNKAYDIVFYAHFEESSRSLIIIKDEFRHYPAL